MSIIFSRLDLPKQSKFFAGGAFNSFKRCFVFRALRNNSLRKVRTPCSVLTQLLKLCECNSMCRFLEESFLFPESSLDFFSIVYVTNIIQSKNLEQTASGATTDYFSFFLLSFFSKL